jgi:DNA polymerase-3 subunit gamma/tau
MLLLSTNYYLATPMENFVVSARKYRPLGFDEVVGQEHITTTLKNAIDNSKLAQALLFCGPRGVGKTTCARIVARMINGFEEKAELNSLNIFELDAASNNSVEDIRNLIDQVRYPPQYGKFKVYIIDEVHMLSNQAFNAFLKTLEEPPSYAIFILATTEKHKVIPTILSRCQIFDFNRIQVSDIAKQLKKIADREKIKTEEAALHLIAQKADGALRDGLSMFDLMVTFSSSNQVTFSDVLKNLHILDYEYYFKVVDGLLAENPSAPLILLDEILRKGFDGQHFIAGLSEHIRNLMVAQDARTVQLMEVPESTQVQYAAQAKAAPYSMLLSWLNIASQCDINYKASKNQRLLVELALMKMAHVNHVLSVNGSGSQPLPAEAVKKK